MSGKVKKIIGIDLGTTNSCVAVMINGVPEIVENLEGKRTTPSVIFIDKNGTEKQKFVIGDVAKRNAAVNPDRTFYDVKRYIGQTYGEIKEQLNNKMPFVVKNDNDKILLCSNDSECFTPEQLSSNVLRYLVDSVHEKYPDIEIAGVVITVPAYFNDSQRKATQVAAQIANLKVERIINEPTAAALCYLSDEKKNGRVAVFDLGGGTFDVSILEKSPDGTIQVLSTNGINHLGGSDFDNRIINYIVDQFKKEHGVDLSANPASLQRLKEAAETAKINLSNSVNTSIVLPFIHNNITADYSLSRAKFEQLVGDLVDQVVKPCQTALQDAKLQPKDIDFVLLVGGSTRIPKVIEKVEEIFGKKPLKGVNPDEAVAVGAAIQGGILCGENKSDILLMDVTPLSLGIETAGGVFNKLIEKNTTIPTKKSQVYTTAADNQESVSIVIYQGEREIANKNKKLGQFNLEGIPPAPRGVPQIEVTFDIDVNGVVHVSAKDQKTGKSNNISIQNSTSISDEEIKRMQQEAEQYAEEDKQRKLFIEARNQAENLLYTADNTLKKQENLSEAVRNEIEDKRNQLKESLEREDVTVELLTKHTDELSDALQKSYEDISKNAEQNQGSENASQDKSAEEPKEPS